MSPFPVLVAVLAWICLGLETGLKGAVAYRVGNVWAAPSFIVPLAVFVALCAQPAQALWTCLALGLALDLTSVHPTDTGAIVVAGPYALGLLIAGQFVLTSRGFVIRRHVLTLVALSIAASMIIHIVVVAFFTVRQIYTPLPGWSATSELGGRFLSALFTGGSALFMWIALIQVGPALGLPAGQMRRR